jgi:hypothetical protein
MKLLGTNNALAELELQAFEYGKPLMVADEDWLKIKLKIYDSDEKWEVVDPALTAAEVHQLIFWLYDLYADKQVEKSLHFLEPLLSFQLLHDRGEYKIIKIRFDHELKPGWHKMPGEYAIVCRIEREHLHTLANNLLTELQDVYAKAGFDFLECA